MGTPASTILHDTQPQRVDRLLSNHFPNHSRSYFQQLITDKCVLLNGSIINKSSTIVKPGDTLSVTFPQVKIIGALPLPAHDMGIRIIYEHQDFLIVYKPAGVLMHAPNKYSDTVTLVDWLVHSFKELKLVGSADRPGIVHRLDKDTSGLLIVPRNNTAHAAFSHLFAQRLIQKTYHALVTGHTQPEGTVDYAIARHPIHKHKMAHTRGFGRESVTHYKMVKYFSDYSLIEVYPTTGRTHQIRVHCAAIGHAIIGDAVYGLPSKSIDRQALHAYQLTFSYQGVFYSFWHDMPKDMKKLTS